MRIAFLGYGHVGSAVATAVLRAGHDAVLAESPHRPQGAAEARARTPGLGAATVAGAHAAVEDADLVVLAVPFGAVEATLAPLRGALAGRVLVDATNPVGPGLTHGLGSQRSGAEHISGLLPDARVVKAFSVYGFENLTQPHLATGGIRSVMPYAGDDPGAKERVATLLGGLGWDPLDVGGLPAALQLEHLTLLWIRMVRAGGEHPLLTWAAVRGPRPAERPA